MANLLAPLTPRQQTVLQFIESFIHTQGVPPTRAEICTELGFRSPNAAEDHLRALAHKGAIELIQGAARGIRLSPTSIAPKHHSRDNEWHLPVVGKVAAGNPITAVEHIEKTLTCHAGLFTQKPDFLVRVKGMSMRDAGIIHNDLLGVCKTPQAQNGKIVVARLDDEVTVKRYFKTPHSIELHPENPDFKTLIIPADEAHVFILEGVVVGLIREQIAI